MNSRLHRAASRSFFAVALIAWMACPASAGPGKDPRKPSPAKPRGAAARPDRKTGFDELVRGGFSALKAGNLADAMARAETAVADEPDRYEGHFLGGLTLYRREMTGSAEEWLRKALSLAPPEGKEPVRTALETLETRKVFLERSRAGREAEDAGLFAKAAREYAVAWNAAKDEEETGLRSARLWIERTGSPLEAVPILRHVVAGPKSPESLQQARALLDRVKPQLASLSKGRAETAAKAAAEGRHGEADRLYRQAIEAAPDDPDLRWRLADLSAKVYLSDGATPGRLKTVGDDLASAVRSAGEAGTEELIGRMLDRPALGQLLRSPAFRPLLDDMFGPDHREAVEKVAAARKAEAERRRQDEARKAAKARRDRLVSKANGTRVVDRDSCVRVTDETLACGEGYIRITDGRMKSYQSSRWEHRRQEGRNRYTTEEHREWTHEIDDIAKIDRVEIVYSAGNERTPHEVNFFVADQSVDCVQNGWTITRNGDRRDDPSWKFKGKLPRLRIDLSQAAFEGLMPVLDALGEHGARIVRK